MICIKDLELEIEKRILSQTTFNFGQNSYFNSEIFIHKFYELQRFLFGRTSSKEWFIDSKYSTHEELLDLRNRLRACLDKLNNEGVYTDLFGNVQTPPDVSNDDKAGTSSPFYKMNIERILEAFEDIENRTGLDKHWIYIYEYSL